MSNAGGVNPYDDGLDRNPANYQALTPLGFIERAAAVYPGRMAVIHGERRHT
jgi:fatty-acyl-CoA synthase